MTLFIIITMMILAEHSSKLIAPTTDRGTRNKTEQKENVAWNH